MDNKYIPYIFIGLLTVLIFFLLSIPTPKIPVDTSVQDNNIVNNREKEIKDSLHIDSLNKVIALDEIKYAKKKVQIIYRDKENEKKYIAIDSIGVLTVTKYIRTNFQTRQY